MHTRRSPTPRAAWLAKNTSQTACSLALSQFSDPIQWLGAIAAETSTLSFVYIAFGEYRVLRCLLVSSALLPLTNVFWSLVILRYK